jgi:hypothetical protein
MRRADAADEALERLHAARAGRPYDAAILDMELQHSQRPAAGGRHQGRPHHARRRV